MPTNILMPALSPTIPFFVMPGLDPGISMHSFSKMAGPSPAMTR